MGVGVREGLCAVTSAGYIKACGLSEHLTVLYIYVCVCEAVLRSR